MGKMYPVVTPLFFIYEYDAIYVTVQCESLWINNNTYLIPTYLSRNTFAYSSVCFDHLGVENGDIKDGNIQASSIYYDNQAFSTYKGRLNGNSYWATNGGINEPWIQADIGYQTYVSGVATQGYPQEWVTSIKVSTFFMTAADDEIFVFLMAEE